MFTCVALEIRICDLVTDAYDGRIRTRWIIGQRFDLSVAYKPREVTVDPRHNRNLSLKYI